MVEAQPGLAIIVVGAVALVTIFGKDRTNIPVKLDFRGGADGQKIKKIESEREKQREATSRVRHCAVLIYRKKPDDSNFQFDD